jgi:ribosomal protein S18 acetylase RimI-like enzyme
MSPDRTELRSNNALEAYAQERRTASTRTLCGMSRPDTRALAVALVDGPEASEVAERVKEGLARHNEPKIGPRRSRPLVLSLNNENGELVGGLVGKTYWNALHIELLWVSESHRRSGYGRRLIETAENEGRTRGAEVAYVTTLSFQSPELYEHLGYTKFGELEGLPKGASRLWYSKRLATNAA